MSYALVLACDLTPDGLELGPKTILRLRRGLAHALDTGDRLVVAASMSPRHPDQPKPMAEMMAEWLYTEGLQDVSVLRAPIFNTRGELRAFFTLSDAEVIISAPWHLRRTKLLVWQEWGRKQMRSLQYIPVPEHRMSAKERFLLEPLKLSFEVAMLATPASYRMRIWQRGVSLISRFTNPSW